MFSDDGSIVLRTPAKINLWLEIKGRRENGYHELRSLLVPVSLFDTVTLSRTDGGIRTELVGGAGVCREALSEMSADDNLCTRAARAMKEATGHGGGVLIQLEKQIPVGGGLGGGSADAAAVLVGLNRLWDVGLSMPVLMAIGAKLGCDIPALVHGGPVCMEGVGERISAICGQGELPAKPLWLVLVYPGFPVSTADIYRRYQKCLTPTEDGYINAVRALKKGEATMAAGCLFNGLQATVFCKYPLIEMIADGLRRAGALGAMVSGSGASVLGLAESCEHAECVAGKLDEVMGCAFWRQVVSTLPGGVKVAHGPLKPFV